MEFSRTAYSFRIHLEEHFAEGADEVVRYDLVFND